MRSGVGPLPLADFGSIGAFLPRIVGIGNDLILHLLFDVRTGDLQPGHPVDDINDQIKAINLVAHSQIQRCVDLVHFLVPAHMHVMMVRASVGQPVDQPGVAVEVEDHRFIERKEAVKIPIRQAVTMLTLWLQLEQVNDVDKTEFEIREVFAQQSSGSQRFHGGDIARTGQHHIRFTILIGTGPIPDPNALGAVLNRLLQRQMLQMELLIGDDNIYIADAAQTVVRHRQQAVGIGRQINTGDLGTFVGHNIQKPRVLMAKAVVVLAPDHRGNQ